ncbi:hypothetical protein, partial [Bradyrhizobium iriomotense]|uniref:hypothetical protein n=1 Tax=Bradyrhizobium iriomotense TaxID=441950 RepID=UPI001B89E2DF
MGKAKRAHVFGIDLDEMVGTARCAFAHPTAPPLALPVEAGQELVVWLLRLERTGRLRGAAG